VSLKAPLLWPSPLGLLLLLLLLLLLSPADGDGDWANTAAGESASNAAAATATTRRVRLGAVCAPFLPRRVERSMLCAQGWDTWAVQGQSPQASTACCWLWQSHSSQLPQARCCQHGRL
jgi:hypothetical protein